MLEYRQAGNTAFKPQHAYEPEYNPVYEPTYRQHREYKQHVRRENAKELSVGLKLRIVFRVLLVTALALLMVARYAAVSAANIEMEEVRSAVQEQREKNVDLEAVLAGTMQVDTIQTKAMEKGMSFPSADQMVYLQVTPYNDLVEKNSEKQSQESEVKTTIRQVID